MKGHQNQIQVWFTNGLEITVLEIRLCFWFVTQDLKIHPKSKKKSWTGKLRLTILKTQIEPKISQQNSRCIFKKYFVISFCKGSLILGNTKRFIFAKCLIHPLKLTSTLINRNKNNFSCKLSENHKKHLKTMKVYPNIFWNVQSFYSIYFNVWHKLQVAAMIRNDRNPLEKFENIILFSKFLMILLHLFLITTVAYVCL